jgi:hypothetical protein
MLSGAAGEKDQARFVGLQAFDVQGEGFGIGVLAARVDGDADCGSEFAGDFSFLEDMRVSWDLRLGRCAMS